MEKLTPLVAIRKFINKGASVDIPISELRTFWVNCTTEQKQEYSKEAAREVGAELVTV